MNSVPVIYYHSVGPKNLVWRKNFLTMELQYFESQLKYLSENYNIIGLKDYWAIRNALREPVNKPLILSFDDGYLDNWQYVYPLLKKYKLKATIFVSPEFIDSRSVIRPNLEDIWSNNAVECDLNQWGFLSWDEMRIMEESGVIDIQSHTMSHTKFLVSGKLIDFHRPDSDCLYYIGNLYPEMKPYYIGDPEFEGLLPYGYPVFEMKSSVIARKVEINTNFINFCIDALKDYDFRKYHFEKTFKIIQSEYEKYCKNDSLILSTESENEYGERVKYEIYESKKIIEGKLNKKVNFLCWPHGDNDDNLHRIALEAGYLMTTIGKAKGISKSDSTRIPERVGIDFSSWCKKQKNILKLKTFSGKSPYNELLGFFRQLNH